MRLVDFFQSFIDLFRSRYVKYLEGEVIRLRQETAGLNTTLLASKGIQVVASPDLQDLEARGRKKRHEGAPERLMKPVVRASTHATWKRNLERKSAQEALEFEAEIKKRKEAREEVDAAQR